MVKVAPVPVSLALAAAMSGKPAKGWVPPAVYRNVASPGSNDPSDDEGESEKASTSVRELTHARQRVLQHPFLSYFFSEII
jgi:hypothetical protein